MQTTETNNLDTQLRDAARQRADITALVCMDRRAGLLVGGPHASAVTSESEVSAESMVQASVAMPGHPDLVVIGVANGATTTTTELQAWLEEVAGRL